MIAVVVVIVSGAAIAEAVTACVAAAIVVSVVVAVIVIVIIVIVMVVLVVIVVAGLGVRVWRSTRHLTVFVGLVVVAEVVRELAPHDQLLQEARHGRRV